MIWKYEKSRFLVYYYKSQLVYIIIIL